MWNLGIIPGARRDLTIFGSIQLATLEWIKKTSLIIDFINFWIWACSSYCHLPNAQIMSTFFWFRVHLSSLGLGGIHPNDILKVQYLPFSTNEDFDVTPTDWELPIFESSPRRPACESGGLSVSTQNQHVPMVNSCSISPRSHQFHVFFSKNTHTYIYIYKYIYTYFHCGSSRAESVTGIWQIGGSLGWDFLAHSKPEILAIGGWAYEPTWLPLNPLAH